MAEGTKHDQGKNRLELVSADFIKALREYAQSTGDPPPSWDRMQVVINIKRWGECDPGINLIEVCDRIAWEIDWADGDDDSLSALGHVLTFGAKKYSAWNWSQGFEWSRLVGAAMRHVRLSGVGDGTDDETGFPHLWHAMCCLMFLYVHQLRGLGTDDRKRWCNEPRVREEDFIGHVIAEGNWTHVKLPLEYDSKQRVVADETIRAKQPQVTCDYCGCVRDVHLQSCAKATPDYLGRCEMCGYAVGTGGSCGNMRCPTSPGFCPPSPRAG